MFRKLKITCCIFRLASNYCTRVQLDGNLRPQFDSQEYKPRKHPGKVRFKIAALPPDIKKSILTILQDKGAKAYYQDSITLNNYLNSRLLPPEDGDIDEKAAKIYERMSSRILSKPEDLSAEDEEKLNKKVQVKVFNKLKSKLYRWANIAYDEPTGLQYLMSRAAPEYAVLVHIFDEINRRVPDYKPRSFFDFGSGIGSGTWAVNTFWKSDLFEYFSVDTSPAMHDLARLILCNGRENVELPYRAYFQRQFLPASSDLKYSIVLSAYSLLEMPNMKSRLETIQKLWNKTEDYLIIVEKGTNAGFQIVNEAREFILNLKRKKGYAFAPCPNDNVCPRYMEHKTPCNFLMKYEPLPFPSQSDLSAELFSYIVLKKGERPKEDNQWPRVVRAPIVRSKHTICRLCTSTGELKEIIFSKRKYDQETYRTARTSNWGDLLPVK